MFMIECVMHVFQIQSSH